MKNIVKIFSSFVLITAIVLHICACGAGKCGGDLSGDITKNPVTGKDADEVFLTSQWDFAAEIFRQSAAEKGENALVSPLSVMIALAMTANGAEGETKKQMESVLGGTISIEQLNEYLHTYVENLPTSEKAYFSMANSIWVDEPEISVREEFLQTNADYYDADVFSERFDGDKTCDKINAWVEENTNGMIKDILNEVPESTVMFLVNALAFEAEWRTEYAEYSIREADFTEADGEKVKVEMMHSEEDVYLHDKNTTGFIKRYQGGYSFVALLPDEGMTIEEYVEGLTGKKLQKLLESREYAEVNASLPKFEYEYDIQMNGILQNMGMVDAFDGAIANLSNMGESKNGNLFISRVLHKTFIKVDNLGTKAGAATVVAVDTESGSLTPPKVVRLDRPFVYMIIDDATNLPIFIGMVTSFEG